MKILRNLESSSSALADVKNCLDKIECETEFKNNLDFNSKVVRGLTLQKIIATLINAEHELEANEDEIESLRIE